jgi:hypothetical protein
MWKPRCELLEEIARCAPIAHADVMHRQCAVCGELSPEAVDRHIVKLIESIRIGSLINTASVAVAKKDLFGPFFGLFHFIQLLVKCNRNPPCPTKKPSDLCR